MARGKAARARRTSRRAALKVTGTESAPQELFFATLGARRQAREARAEVSPDTMTLRAMEARLTKFADEMPNCSDCSHAFDDHADGGPCTIEDCECASYVDPDSDGDREPDDDAAVEFSATAELIAALDLVGEAVGHRDAARDYVLSRLDGFALVDDPVAETLPPEHQPASTAPERDPGPAAPEAPATTDVLSWSAILAPEGKLTSDRRAFAPGSISWRELPLTLMAMTETSEGGHIGAEVAGRIDAIWRDERPYSANFIRGAGMFDTGEYGREIARLVDDGTLRGNSVDLAINKYITGPRAQWFDENGNWDPQETADSEPTLLDYYDDDIIAVVLEAEIGMSTVCPFPAFAEAKIAVGDSLVAGANPAFWTITQQGGWTVEHCPPCEAALAASAALSAAGAAERTAEADLVSEPLTEPLTASAAGLAPESPPAEWFADPLLTEPTALVVTDDGQIYGHAALWGVCHLGFPNSCKTAPHSDSGYTYFHLGEVLCENGERIPCGQITLDAPHADLRLDRANATAHYDHTGTVVAHVVAGEDEHGIWVAGALVPDAPAEKVRLLRGSKLSGDWRGSELVALLCVNVPGFPVPRAQALAASVDGGEPEVVAMVAAGIPIFAADLTAEEQKTFETLRLRNEFALLV